MSSKSPQANPENSCYDRSGLHYDEAQILVERYFRADVERSITRVNHVLSEFDKEITKHNQRRILEILQERCEVIDRDTNRPLKFRIPEEYCNG